MSVSRKSTALRAVIENFLQERFDAKVAKLAEGDPRREALAAQFQVEAWVEDAARRVNQLQVVTHALKPIHPDARGTNLYAPPQIQGKGHQVGSHCLGNEFDVDVVGNAAALDVYKFLKLEYEGKTLLARTSEEDTALAEALSADRSRAQRWMKAFASITQARGDDASHTLSKQLYWLVGDDPSLNEHYHLLAPLFPTSLVHRIHRTINEDRFGEAAKAARQARREKRLSENGYHEYPHLAARKLGGTKPQNISQLNSERGGINYLLASLPPKWDSPGISPPLGIDSVFRRFGHRPVVRQQVWRLRRLLRAAPSPNRETRDRRNGHVETLIDELMMWAAAHAELEPGWSASVECRLPEAECFWLDPYRDDDDFQTQREHEDWPEDIVGRFANWLNHQLSADLPVGDAEYKAWKGMIVDKQDALREVLSYA